MSSCLILVDLQNDYFPGGKMELTNIEEAATNAHRLLNHYRSLKTKIIHIQHLSLSPGASFFVPGTVGAEIHKMVSPQENETVVQKNYPNGFRDTPLLKILHDSAMTDLVICGAMSHMCIDATTRAAFDLGFNCIVAEDACATRDLVFKGKMIDAAAVHASFMAALSTPYAKIAATEDLLGESPS